MYSNFLYAVPMLNHFNCDSDSLPHGSAYSNSHYYDIYRCHDIKNPGGYALGYKYLFGSGTRVGNFFIEAAYNRNVISGKIDNLSEMKDHVRFNYAEEFTKLSCSTKIGKNIPSVSLFVGTSPGMEVRFRRKSRQFWSNYLVSYQEEKANISYDVRDEKGIIPFSFSKSSIQGSICTVLTKHDFQYTIWLPGERHAQFDNRLSFQDMNIRNSLILPKGIRSDLSARYRIFSGKLKYDGEQYAYIDYLQMIDIHLKMTKQYEHSIWGFGSDYYHTWSGSDSYFDIWPFTAWDIFLANRTRLKSFDIDCFIPTVSYEYQNSFSIMKTPITYSINPSYSHVFHKEDLEIKNRIVVMYPFLFAYEIYDYQANNLDGYFSIPLKSEFNIGRVLIQLKISQLVPVNWNQMINKPSSTTTTSHNKKTEWGGTFYNLDLSLPF